MKCTVFLADIKEWGDFNEVYRKAFPDNLPARSALGANGLALGARVEVECIAHVLRREEVTMSNAPLLPVPVPLADLVALQPGAVVSRTLVKTGGGTVTAFAFDTRRGALRALGAVRRARDRDRGRGRGHDLEGPAPRPKRGDLLRLPANEPHGLKALTPFKMLLVMVKA